MKPILIFCFVVSFGILTLLAEKITHLEQREGPASNADPSVIYHDALMKRGANRGTSGVWHKVNSPPVCFGAKNNQFGRFYVPSSGKLGAVKLVHRYGYVSCDTRKISHWSYWGCGTTPCSPARDDVNIVITTSANHTILPAKEFIVSETLKWYKIPGYNSLSPELVLSVFSQPHGVTAGQELRLWNGEDLVNQSEGDNGGSACCDVYVHYA